MTRAARRYGSAEDRADRWARLVALHQAGIRGQAAAKALRMSPDAVSKAYLRLGLRKGKKGLALTVQRL